MPRNITGGSGHKAQRNTESSKARHNREFIADLLDDIARRENTDGIYVGRVTRRLGSGRMMVFYHKIREDGSVAEVEENMPMRVGLRGSGKKQVWVDLDALVMMAETGLRNTPCEIIAVFSPEQIARYRALVPNADPRLFMKSTSSEEMKEDDGGIEFADEEVDVDAI